MFEHVGQAAPALAPAIEIHGAQEVRCDRCGRLLLRQKMMPGSQLELKCPKCKAIVQVEVL